MKNGLPYITLRSESRPLLYNTFFNIFYETDKFAKTIAFNFCDESGKITNAKYRLQRETLLGFLYRLDKRSIRFMRRAQT